ncbi:MGH1-like glycoside hydrolase domain-containing protein [Paenibacillus fonticola]|uniref:MGH1-like glycoside hydrolase domain-containing protein n=1 Tax=Paenibacillus fonticola TaxID=379896 RepID=UPI00039D9F9C
MRLKESLLTRLLDVDAATLIGKEKQNSHGSVLEEWQRSGVKFVSSSERFEGVYYSAARKLLDCIFASRGGAPVLYEGGAYPGTWLESTGTINAELLSRFVPGVAEATFRLFAEHQRDNGQMPYKVTEQGPAYRQIQMVTPLARSVWNHCMLNGSDTGDKAFLRTMYTAMARFDEWLSLYRNTRGTGCVEAFCTFDTGHDLSPRFWHVPDSAHLDDARQYDPASPILPFLAPDLTANVYCQRKYLARMARELGADAEAAAWEAKAKQSEQSLFKHCFDEVDEFFYDVDRNGEFVRVQSDVLLRVLACETGDRVLFDKALRRYLLNTSKFFAKYPLTSVAMDDPRFDPSSAYNSWAGTTNFLTLIRTPHAFEYHERYVELTWLMQPIMSAMARMTRFPQTLSPWTGAEGYTDTYSPSILCVLDFVERMCGIMPTPGGELWFTGLLPYPMDHGEEVAGETAYSRFVDGVQYELMNTRAGATVYRNGEVYMRFPYGTRAVTDRYGQLREMVGMTYAPVQGEVELEGRVYTFDIKGNERKTWTGDTFVTCADIGMVVPAYR